MRLGRRSAPVLAALVATVAGLLGLEALTRLVGLRAPDLAEAQASDRALWRYDSTKGWFHTPGAQGRCYYGGPDAGTVRINRLGLRGLDPQPVAPTGGRVLVLGDSFVFGVGVDEGHVFSSQLERQLAAHGRVSEVLNLGVSGYSTDQELILLRELGAALRPNVVLLVMCDNDFEGNTLDFAYRRYYKPYFVREAAEGLLLQNAPVPRLQGSAAARLWLGEHSNLWNLVRGRRSSWPAMQAVLDAMQPAIARRTSDDPAQITAAILGELKVECEKLGARLVVTNTGHRGEHTEYFHALRPLLDDKGILYDGMEPILGAARAGNRSGLWDFQTDTHWNVDAHRVAARAMALFLERRVYR